MHAVGLSLIACTFALAGYVTVASNRMADRATPLTMQAELTALLHQNGLSARPLGAGQATSIKAAVRFAIPDCPADGFLLPEADTFLSDAQAIRFTELTNVAYRSKAVTPTAGGGLVQGRIVGALAALAGIFTGQRARHSRVVLILFTPVGCDVPRPDLRAFWRHDGR